MHYDYKCADCGLTKDVEHPMTDKPTIECECGSTMYRSYSVPTIIPSRRAGRSAKRPDTPSNEEYHAYNAWERSGRQDDYKKLLAARGEL